MLSIPWRFVLLSCAVTAAPAVAETAAGEQLAWRCWYDQRTHVTCILRSAPAQLAPVALPANLPGVVRELRENPQAFRDRFLHIPLNTPAVDMRFAALLARATVCGSRPDCSVSFDAVPPNRAELHAMEARLLERETEVAMFGSALPDPPAQ